METLYANQKAKWSARLLRQKYEQIHQFTLVLMTDESEKVTGRVHGKEYARIIFVIKLKATEKV